MPLYTRELLLESPGVRDPGAENTVLRLQGSRCMPGEGDPKILDFLRIRPYRGAPQIPDRETGGEDCHANDRHADQVEAAVGWMLPPHSRRGLH